MRSHVRFFILFLVVGLLAAPAYPSAVQANALRIAYLSGYPTLRQQHPLTCEASTASMATAGRISEARIMAVLPRNLDPNLGFRGNPDGHQASDLRNYGVYPGPLSRALNRFGFTSQPLFDSSDLAIRNYISRGWPVIAWVTYALEPETPRWVLQNGRGFVLVPHEHTILIVGYDARTLVANDPWTGTQVRYRWADFNRSWAYLGRLALAVQPCTAPPAVSGAAASRSHGVITWHWTASQGASAYQVTLFRQSSTGSWQQLSLTSIPGTTYTATAESKSSTYDLRIAAVSACGATGASVDVISAGKPTETTISPTPTATPAPATPSASATPEPTETATSTPTAGT